MLVARINPRLAGYTPANVGVFYRKLYDRLTALPGVRAATVSSYSPFGGSTSRNSGKIEGYTPKPGEDVELETIFVGPSYPDALGIALRQGRPIGLQDGAGAPLVAMVNEAFARKYFLNQNPIGHRFELESPGYPYEIVGVLADAQFHDVKEQIKPIVFLALLQQMNLDACLIGPPDAGTKEAVQPFAPNSSPVPRGPFWAVGVRTDNDVLLFDPWRGKAFPEPLSKLKSNPDSLKAWFEETRAEGSHVLVERPDGKIREVISV